MPRNQINQQKKLRNNKSFGKKGEDFAVNLLQNKGFKILDRNYKTKTSEVDIIVYKDKVIYFVEVKTRHSSKYGFPEEVINRNKLHKIKQAGYQFLKLKGIKNIKTAIMIVAFIIKEGRVIYSKIIYVD